MSDNGVGYCKPPVHSRWKPGQSGNSKGRALRKRPPLAQYVDQVMNGPTEYRERGRLKRVPWHELSLRMLVDRAAKGDVGAADDILKIYLRAQRQSGGRSQLLVVENWLPDHPGQTAKEKNSAVQNARYDEPDRSL